MTNVYSDPYMPGEEDMVEVGDLGPWGHKVSYKQRISKKVLKKRAEINSVAQLIWDRKGPYEHDNRILCRASSPWADCIEALEIYEKKTP